MIVLFNLTTGTNTGNMVTITADEREHQPGSLPLPGGVFLLGMEDT
jgi:hypothetical protein